MANFSTHATYVSSAILWPIFNSCKWRRLVAKFGTNASGATISWRDNSSLDAIPWVRCASGNVLVLATAGLKQIAQKLFLAQKQMLGD